MKMKHNVLHIFFAFLFVILNSCIDEERIKDIRFESNTDSLIFQTIHTNYPYKHNFKFKDSIPFNVERHDTIIREKFENIIPLIKRVYYSKFDITLEFRQSFDCHHHVEYVFCYDSLNCCIIPFTDNYYFNKYRGDTAEYRDIICLEDSINNALQTFKYKSHYTESFPDFFVKVLFEESTKFHFKAIYQDDLIDIYNKQKRRLSNPKYIDSICVETCLPELEKLINIDKKGYLYYMGSLNLIYHINIDRTKYLIDLDYYNEECYEAWIF